MKIFPNLKISSLRLIPVLPQIAELISVYLKSVDDGKLTLTEAVNLTEKCLKPILKQLKLDLPVYVLEILPTLLVKLQKATVLVIEEASEKDEVV